MADSEDIKVADVIRICPDSITLQDRNILDVVENVKWSYVSKYRTQPNFMIIGGNFYRKLMTELFSAGIGMDGRVVGTVSGLKVVRVKRDALEMGE